MPETETLYVKVRREVKEKLEKLARESGAYLVDVASEALERGLGFKPTSPSAKILAEKLVGTWKNKMCRYLAEDGYCQAWQLTKDEAEQIYGEAAKDIFELRTIERSSFFYTEKVEAYCLKPSPAVCFYCPFFERK